MKAFSKQNELPLLKFHQGGNYHVYDLLGSKSSKRKNGSGAVFRVWAPHGLSVSVVGEFSKWERSMYPMEEISEGVWEAFVPGIKQGDVYQYSIETADGSIVCKSDPYAYMMTEGKSAHYDISRFAWKDEEWMERRKLRKHLAEPLNIYEVHAASWKQGEDAAVLNYRKLADELVPYAADMGYTHIQLLPVMEHKTEKEQYDISAYFAPSSRYGTAKDFMYLVNKCHQNDIGIILDWIPGHFPKDEQGMAKFDGQLCYEYEDNQWSSCIFDFSKAEVNSFLISNAMYWIEKYHVDGLRVDAVSSMLYMDYGRENSGWRHANPASVDFLKRMNSAIHNQHPDVMMIAEEASTWPMITKPIYGGGLGFTFKWNSGWSHDMLQYMSMDPIYRAYNHDKITFSLMYAFTENFVLPLSHDEVSNGRGSLIQRMPGEHKQKLDGVRAFLGYMMSHPGKKLQFMGNELGQFIEWSDSQPLDWQLLDFDSHRKLKQYVKDLNHFYLSQRPLWEVDNSWDGFQWLVHDDQSQCVVAFRRSDEDGKDLIAVCNFTPVQRDRYRIGIPQLMDYRVAFNSDDAKYGGSALPQPDVIVAEHQPMHGKPYSILLDIPPMSALFLCPKEADEAVFEAVIPE